MGKVIGNRGYSTSCILTADTNLGNDKHKIEIKNSIVKIKINLMS